MSDAVFTKDLTLDERVRKIEQDLPGVQRMNGDLLRYYKDLLAEKKEQTKLYKQFADGIKAISNVISEIEKDNERRDAEVKEYKTTHQEIRIVAAEVRGGVKTANFILAVTKWGGIPLGFTALAIFIVSNLLGS